MADKRDGLQIARQRIAQEAAERTGFLDLGTLGLTCLPEELFELSHLRRLKLGSGMTDEEGEWQEAAEDISPNDVQSDIGQLAKLPKLSILSVRGVRFADLTPLAGLHALQSLDCSSTQVRDLVPLAGLSALQSLDCSFTQVSDLVPLAGLSALQSLDCSRTQVSDLMPLAGLSALQSLNCTYTQVGDLTPLAGLSALQSLNCSDTQVSDLMPLAGLSALQSLDCSFTQVSDLVPLAGLSALQSLNFSGCRLARVPDGLWGKPTLNRLTLYESHLPGVPAEVLSHSFVEDCLDALRAHLDDLAAGQVVVPDAKLMVLGNGYVGKTQIRRRLGGEDFDATVPSTHGITVASATLRKADGKESARLQIWDFGGQDIYHGAHALFMRARAVFMLVWAPERENSGEQIRDGIRLRDYPLAYWLDYVRHLSSTRSPVILVQTRCERPEDDAVRPPVADEALSQFPFRTILHYSAKIDRGRPALDDALNQAVGWLTDEEGVVTIGATRFRVRRRLEELRDTDEKLPVEQRQYRTITQEHFQQLCEEEGGVASAKHFLNYLHNAGVAFYHDSLFDDRIVLDQSWALDAIYAVFNRDKSYKELSRLGGRFSRPLIELLVWQDYEVEEQRLLLSMMQSCGICFLHRRSDNRDENEYIAPDLLPDRGAVGDQIDSMWDKDLPPETAEFEYSLLHSGIVRSVISRIGSDAGVTAVYWKDGLCAYEKTSGSRVLIEQQMDDLWRGRIRVQTQRGQAAALLQRLTKMIQEASSRAGSAPVKITTSAALGHPAATEHEQSVEAKPPPLQFSQEPIPGREYCVSYAWGQPTQAVVDRLCAAAEERGVRVLRDKTAVGLGDSISKFMQRIGRADRVFIVLSDKYLKSPYCMFELFEIWRNNRADSALFAERIRAFTLPSTRIATFTDRNPYASYWDERHRELEDLIRRNPSIVGEADFREFRLAAIFYRDVSDILAAIADILQPRDFDHLEKHWLDDLER
ncbi:MAG: COR domain-containing protein [Stellaceae bacterium]